MKSDMDVDGKSNSRQMHSKRKTSDEVGLGKIDSVLKISEDDTAIV